MTTDLAIAVVDSLDDEALDLLARKLAPRLISHLPGDRQIDPWLSAGDAARHLGLTLNAIHKLTAARTIPFEQEGPGCKLWFRRSELDRWRQGGSGATRGASTPLPQPGEAAS